MGKDYRKNLLIKISNMKRKIGLIVLVFCLSLCIKAQIKPVFNVSGPEVSNLGEYGTIPVGHYTGVPDISIPL